MKYLSKLPLGFCFCSFSLWLVSVCDAQPADDLWKQQKNHSGVQSNSAGLHTTVRMDPHLRLTDEELPFTYKGNYTKPDNEVSSTAAVEVAEESTNESIFTETFFKITMTSASQAKTASMHPAPSTTSVPFNVTEFSSTAEVNTWWRNHSGQPVATSLVLQETTRPPRNTTFFSTLKSTIKKLMSQAGSGFLRKLFHADVSSECVIGIIKFTQALQELKPWALRLVDATAKYPNGLFQMTLADLGAYDECIETVERDTDGIVQVRGQYCDVQIKLTDNNSAVDELTRAVTLSNAKAAKFKSLITKPSLPAFRLGLCFIDACKERDLTNMGRAIAGTGVKVDVKNCVSNEPEEMNRAQMCIIASLVVVAAIIVAATCLDLYAETQDKKLMKVLSHNYFMAFSVLRSSRLLRSTQPNHNFDTRCFHGLRFLSIYWVCLTHMYVLFNANISRLINTVQFSQHWTSPILIAGFLSVDTFFFLSGFLLYHSLNNQKRNRIIGVVIMLIRRIIRTTIPVFFMIMCIYLLPLMVSGPNSKEFYNRFYTEVHDQWWSLLLQIRNWRTEDYQTAPMIQLWYLSADYQLFVVAVLVIQAFGTKKRLVAFVFTALSLITCGVSAWQMYGTNMLPLIIPWYSSYSALHDTLRFSYYLPFYHAVCFFSGCITFFLVKKYGKAEISKDYGQHVGVSCLYAVRYPAPH
ncbi:nose resistant to fluoxetine protein 6-like [Rhipicephalus microplus]|uniref:nose resistant to fluoxetine protein 6-like n=1 Tax=Rhipicephalus microplus TaxID=6941 RepID=UPI003F6BB2A9